MPSIDVSVKGLWPGTPWRNNFYIEYYGLLALGMPGSYTIYLTASVGGVGASCSINGLTVVTSSFSQSSESDESSVSLFSGTMVRLWG